MSNPDFEEIFRLMLPQPVQIQPVQIPVDAGVNAGFAVRLPDGIKIRYGHISQQLARRQPLIIIILGVPVNRQLKLLAFQKVQSHISLDLSLGHRVGAAEPINADGHAAALELSVMLLKM